MSSRFAIAMFCIVTFFGQKIRAEEACPTLDQIVKYASDEPCQQVVEAAEECFDYLNKHYYLLKKSPGVSTAERQKDIKNLRSAYGQEIKKFVRSFQPYLEGKGRACSDQLGELEAIIEETSIDLEDLKRPGF